MSAAQSSRSGAIHDADRYLDVRGVRAAKLPDVDYIWAGFVSGTVGALVAGGGTGKSMFALEAGIGVAGGKSADLPGLNPCATGPVLYLPIEDPSLIIQHRLKAMALQLSEETWDAVADNLAVCCLTGIPLDLLGVGHPSKVESVRWLAQAASGRRLVILDTISRMHCGDENSNGDMARLLNNLEWVCAQTGAAILYLHHIGKGAAREGATDQQAARGASALLDNARWGGIMRRMGMEEAHQCLTGTIEEKELRRHYYVRCGTNKHNYGEPLIDRWYQRHAGGVLLPAELHPVTDQKVEAEYKQWNQRMDDLVQQGKQSGGKRKGKEAGKEATAKPTEGADGDWQ